MEMFKKLLSFILGLFVKEKTEKINEVIIDDNIPCLDDSSIVKNLAISEKWFSGWKRDQKDVQEIVVHGTGGGSSAKALMNWMLSGERATWYKQGIGLFHFIIDRDGTIYQIADIMKWFYHSSSGKHDKLTIGIECMNPDSNNKGDYTDAQYESLAWLSLDYLLKLYPVNRIVSHDYNFNTYSQGRKNCPGNFDWKKLEQAMTDRGVKFSEIITEAYKINV